MGTHPIFESDFDCLTDMSQSSQDSIATEIGNLAVNGETNDNVENTDDEKKKSANKRKRGPNSKESPAKKPKELSRSASTSSLSSLDKRPRGRPRRSLLLEKPIEAPVTTPFKHATAVRGKLLALGMGDAGQLGMGEDIMERKRPQPVKEVEGKVISCAAGGMHNVFITDSGSVYTFGCNDEGALGRKTTEEEECFLPGKVEMANDKGVFCCAGDSHTAILTEDGAVWLWGTFRDANGRLGMRTGDKDKEGEGEKAILHEPTKLDIPTKILRMASGADHLLLLDEAGQVYSLGCAESGQLGRLSSHFCQKGGRRGVDKVLQAATIQLRKVSRKLGKVVDVACGQYSSFLITNAGSVIGFGLNNCYQMGFDDREVRYAPTLIPLTKENGDALKVVKVSSGMHHTLFLTDEGEVYVVGCGDYGRLGVGQEKTIRETKKLLKVNLSDKAVAIGSGSCTSYAVFANGNVYAWGMGSNLQLSTGEEDDEWEPVQMAGKQIDEKKVLSVSGGGQHAIVLIEDKDDTDQQKVK